MRTAVAAIGVLGLAVALTWWTGTAQAQKTDGKQNQRTQICTLKVSGMTCGGCAAAVKMAANKVDGVKDAKASLEKGTAEVTYDPSKTNPEAIANAITKNTGFKAEAPKKDNKR
ncbi:MAG: heavy-metal-associated domain-containing protein [Acidobacteria bacterium]|nr:heavy-metal-associated domain-containing protein [Acidobacteriota bacterium]